jgi:1D-myo-inositol-tetrakisphosphate 5-kinase/inositol-polyphosphate multikinase
LENISASFLKPCILDIKLGTVLYDENASEDKKARMIKAAADTTSLETGVRLTGFMVCSARFTRTYIANLILSPQVHDHTTNQPSITPKSYGKSIKPSDLPSGIARFFPLATSSENGSPSGQGLPLDLLTPVIEGLLADVRSIRAAVARTEMRMVGGSVLVVYEADWERARAGLEKMRSEAEKMAEEEVEEDEEEEEEEDGVGPPYIVRMIDFAHTRFVPGQGPDEGVLLGLDTTIRLFEGRIEQLKQGQGAST